MGKWSKPGALLLGALASGWPITALAVWRQRVWECCSRRLPYAAGL